MSGAAPHRVLVLGGGYAGVVAAARIARERGTAVTLVDARNALVQRIRLHELLAGGAPAVLPYEPMFRRRGIRFVQARVEELHVARSSVVARSFDGGLSRPIGYDTLVLALGSRTAATVPGVVQHAVRLNEWETVRRAAARLATLSAGARVIVVGAGLSGIETAAELAERYPHLAVSLLAAGTVPDGGYAAAGRTHVRSRLAALGVRLVEDAKVIAVEAGAVVLQDGAALSCELCVWAGGFEAASLARDAGLAVDASGRVLVEPGLRALGQDNVFAAGDAAAVEGHGRTLRMGCATALPLGAHVAASVRRARRGEPLEPFAFAYVGRCMSLGRRGGLMQFTTADDAPRDRILAHRPGAWMKELISRTTLWSVRAEAGLGLPVITWPRPSPRSVQLPQEQRSA